MCLMLYIGSPEALPEQETPDLLVEPVEPARSGVMRWFTQPHVQFVGAHTGCSCGFPNIQGDSVIEYFDGMLDGSPNRAADLRSVSALIAIVRQALAAGQPVELYPVWDGDEAKPPKGVIHWSSASFDAERFFFNQQFLHVVDAGQGRAAEQS